MSALGPRLRSRNCIFFLPSVPPRPRLQSSQGGTGSVAAGWDFYVGETGKSYVGVGNESVGFGAGELLLLGGTGTKTSLWEDTIEVSR